MDRLLILFAAGLACGAHPVHAASRSTDGSEPIVVTGQQLKHGEKSSITATRTRTDVVDIPQALTIVTSRQMEDQQLRSIGDLLKYVPGASSGGGEGNRDQLVLRANSSTADFFIDGVRDDVQYLRDLYNTDRLEVLKGPNAMIFGRGGGGGVINRVMKKPMLTMTRAVTASADNWGDIRLASDVDQPLGSILGVRLNAIYEGGHTFRNHSDIHRYGINPTAAIISGRTRIDLSYEHFHDRRTADRGVPANGTGPIEDFTRTFFGDPKVSYASASVDLATLAIEHDFGGGLKLRNHILFGDYRKFYQNVYASGFSATTNLVSLAGYNNRNDRLNLFSQTDFVFDNRLAGIGQTLLFGFEVGQEKSRNRHLTATLVSGVTTPLSDPTVEVDAIFSGGPNDPDNRVKASVAAAYVQDQLHLAQWLEVVAGLRFDTLNIEVDDLHPFNEGVFGRRDSFWSPRLGVVAKPTSGLSLYASYTRSFLPQSGDQFSSLTNVTEGLKPERFDNYEVGAKTELTDGLLVTAALYQLDRSNTRSTDPADPSRTLLTGKQRSFGLELGLERNMTSNWTLEGGYSLESARIVSSTISAPAGRKLPLVPRHSFSLWSRYDVTKALGVGLGLVVRSKSYASISNRVTLPGYARVDAALFYKLRDGIVAQVNAENLLGAHYFPTASNDNNIAPGAPRTIRATLKSRF